MNRHNQPLEKLKKEFTSAPILHHPDRPFVVEVDASETGVGAGLSQHFGERSKLFPVAFFSKKLTQARQNDNISH